LGRHIWAGSGQCPGIEKDKDAENQRLKVLCARAADALKDLDRFAFYCWSARDEKLSELIAELRKAAQ